MYVCVCEKGHINSKKNPAGYDLIFITELKSKFKSVLYSLVLKLLGALDQKEKISDIHFGSKYRTIISRMT